VTSLPLSAMGWLLAKGRLRLSFSTATLLLLDKPLPALSFSE
jgi:hypothetical protein